MMPAVGLSGWESAITGILSAAIPAYSAIETARATKSAADSAASTARIQATLDTQKLALESRMASSAPASGAGGFAGLSVPVLLGGAAAVGFIAYLALRRN